MKLIVPITVRIFLCFAFFNFSSVFIVNAQEESNNIDDLPPVVESFPDDRQVYKFVKIDSMEYSLSSPYHTVSTLLKFLDESTYRTDIALKTMILPQNEDQKAGFDPAIYAIQLKLLIQARGLIINLDDVSLNSNYVDLKTDKYRYTLSNKQPEIYLEKTRKGDWKFSVYSVSKAEELLSDFYPSFTDELVLFTHNVSKGEGKRFLGLYDWQLVAIGIIFILLFISYHLITLIINKTFTTLYNRFKKERFGVEYIKAVTKPLIIILILLIFSFLLPVLQLPTATNFYVVILNKLLMSIYVGVFLYNSVELYVQSLRLRSEKTKGKIAVQLLPLFRVLFQIFAILIALGLILSTLNIPMSNLLAGVSIGGAAVALAAQNMLRNFLGSIMIFTDKPFQVGDWVKVGENEGVVEEVGFRSTRIRTFYNSLISIPNGQVSDREVDNLGERTYRRFKIFIPVTYDTPPDLIEVYLEGLRNLIKNHPFTRKDFYEVRMNEFGSSSLNILFYTFFKVDDWSVELQSREELILQVLKLSDKLGVQIAFPTQTLHVGGYKERFHDANGIEGGKAAYHDMLKKFEEEKEKNPDLKNKNE